jgi:hypothetical protein
MKCHQPTKTGKPCQRETRNGGTCWQHKSIPLRSNYESPKGGYKTPFPEESGRLKPGNLGPVGGISGSFARDRLKTSRASKRHSGPPLKNPFDSFIPGQNWDEHFINMLDRVGKNFPKKQVGRDSDPDFIRAEKAAKSEYRKRKQQKEEVAYDRSEYLKWLETQK